MPFGLPPDAVAFALGFVGSFALELVFVIRCFERGRMPGRYKSAWYWFTRVLFAVAAGVVAWAYYNPAVHPILYIHLGAATPILLVQFASLGPDDKSGE